ncbi:MAG TPA: Ku protein [Methylomirabilota bacterium]
MPPRPLASATISFGLVSIPIRLYPAAVSRHVSFHLLHAKCGNRIKYQAWCPHCEEVVERDQLVKGFEVDRSHHVKMSAEELEALEAEASRDIAIAEFVPLEAVDPVSFDEAYWVGPDKGGAKPYQLLADGLRQAKRVGIARFVMRGKESLVLIRPGGPGLVLHTLYYQDEIRDAGEIDRGATAKPGEAERKLALRLIEDLAHDEFKPERYKDEYRNRVLEVVKRKAKGKAVAIAPARPPKGKVIDLMEALRQSLARKNAPESLARKTAAAAPRRSRVAARKRA